MTVNSVGCVYYSGPSTSSNYPTTVNAFDNSHNGNYDTIISELNADGSNLIYSTYLGGNENDWGAAISVAVNGAIVCDGSTMSNDFPVTLDAWDTSYNGVRDGYICQIDPSKANSLIYSTFIGGNDYDQCLDMAVGEDNSIYISGVTMSSDFPTTPLAFDQSFNGEYDGFIVKFGTTGQIPPTTLTLLEAASTGLIGGYLYRYDNYNDKYGPPILVTFPYTLSPYETYWIEVLQDDLTLVSEYPSSGDDSPLYPQSLESDKWYQVTLPINPSQTGADVRDTFISWSNSELSADTYGNSWRIYKYKYDAVGTGLSDKMFHYDDTGSFNNSMAPGQGYIFKYISPGETFDRFVVPDVTGPTTDVRLKIPFHPDVDDDEFTLHLVGNPFRRDLDMSSNVKIEWPMDSSAPLAKPVSIPLDQIETWYIGLKLASDSDSAISDEYNRAGVAINYSGSTRPLCALDMVPPDNYLRLALKNPSDDTGTPFAYDIRPAGADSYTWDMELTTTYDEINAKLTFDSLESIPEGYEFTLTDKATGTAITIDNNTVLDVALSSATPREYELTATAISTGIDESGRPTAFGITGTMPNPFNPVVTIAYSLEEYRNMRLNIYNISGQLVETLVDGSIEAGRHSVVWNAAGHASGTYIVSLETQGKRDIRKITFMK